MKICFYNNKGGVGKTTLSTSVAFRAKEKGISLTLIDLDAQLNSIKWVSNDTYSGEDSLTFGSVFVTTQVPDVISDNITIIDAPPDFNFVEGIDKLIPSVDVWIVPVKGRFSLDGATNLIAKLKSVGRGQERIVFVSNNSDVNTKFGKRELDEVNNLGVEVFKYPIGRNLAFEKAEDMLCSVWSVPYSQRSGAVQNLMLFSDWVLKGCPSRSTYGDKE